MNAIQNISISIVEMTPCETAGGGGHLSIDYAFVPTPFGRVLIAATGKGICLLFFADNTAEATEEMREMFPAATFTERMNRTMESVLEVITGPDDGVAERAGAREGAREGEESCKGPVCVPLHLKGTPFQMAVWRSLLEIPRGRLCTYSEIAARVGRPKACRATGSAVGANPVSILVPCHRVVRSGGGLGGYRWGIERKKILIDNELERTL